MSRNSRNNDGSARAIGDARKASFLADDMPYPQGIRDPFLAADDMPGIPMVKTGQSTNQALVPIFDHGKEDRRTMRATGAEGNAGTASSATVDVLQVPPGQEWYLERIAYASADAGAGPFVVKLLESPQATRLDDIDLLDTSTLIREVKDFNQPILVTGSQRVIAVWTGLTAASASRVTLRIQYCVVQV